MQLIHSQMGQAVDQNTKNRAVLTSVIGPRIVLAWAALKGEFLNFLT